MTNWGFSFFEKENLKKPIKTPICVKIRKRRRKPARCPAISLKYTCIPEIILKPNITQTAVLIPYVDQVPPLAILGSEATMVLQVCDFGNISLFTNLWLAVIFIHILFKLLLISLQNPIESTPFVFKFIRNRRILAIKRGTSAASQTESHFSDKSTEILISSSEQATQALVNIMGSETQTMINLTDDIGSSPILHHIQQDTKFTQTNKPLPYNPLADVSTSSFIKKKKEHSNTSLNTISSIHDKLEAVWFKQYLQDKSKVLDGAPLGYALSFDRKL